MAKKRRNGEYWAIEFAGEQVRLCRFRLRGERAELMRCETVAADHFDFRRLSGSKRRAASSDLEILCAVPRSEVLLKPFSVPRRGEIDVGKVAALKLEQSIGQLDGDTTLWGYCESVVEDGHKLTHVLAAAMPRAYVERLIERHFPDSERPTAIECGALAAVRAHLALREKAWRCELLVDCAPDGTSFFIIKNSVIESAHFVPGHVSVGAAVAEIRRLILHSRSKREDAPIEAVTCLGGERAVQLADALRSAFDLPIGDRLVRAPQWLSNPDALPAGWERQWHRIIGLIEMARTGGEGAIDFLAGERMPSRAAVLVPALERLRTPVLAVALAGLLGATFVIHGALGERRQALMSRVINRARQATSDLMRSQQAVIALKRYRGERYSLSRLLIHVAEIAPPGIKLKSLSLNPDGSVAITGYCQRFAEGQEFERKLNESELFESAKTTSLGREGNKIAFKTTFKLSGKARRIGR